MNKTGIEWADHVWNPLTGCRHHCEYSKAGCYAQAMARYRKTTSAKAFLPEYHPERLGELVEATKGITFAGSNGDLFGAWVPEEQVKEIVETAAMYWMIKEFTQSIMFLTKNPARYVDSALPVLRKHLGKIDASIWLGTTLDKGFTSKGWDENLPGGQSRHCSTPDVEERYTAIHALGWPKKWLSIEPLAPGMGHYYFDLIMGGLDVQWVVIGAKTPTRAKDSITLMSDAEEITGACLALGIPVFVKSSIVAMNPDWPWCRDFPAGVKLATKPASYQPEA